MTYRMRKPFTSITLAIALLAPTARSATLVKEKYIGDNAVLEVSNKWYRLVCDPARAGRITSWIPAGSERNLAFEGLGIATFTRTDIGGGFDLPLQAKTRTHSDRVELTLVNQPDDRELLGDIDVRKTFVFRDSTPLIEVRIDIENLGAGALVGWRLYNDIALSTNKNGSAFLEAGPSKTTKEWADYNPASKKIWAVWDKPGSGWGGVDSGFGCSFVMQAAPESLLQTLSVAGEESAAFEMRFRDVIAKGESISRTLLVAAIPASDAKAALAKLRSPECLPPEIAARLQAEKTAHPSKEIILDKRADRILFVGRPDRYVFYRADIVAQLPGSRDKTDFAPLNYNTMTLEALGFPISAAEIARYRLIVFLDIPCAYVPESGWDLVEAFVNAGGVVVMAGDHAIGHENSAIARIIPTRSECKPVKGPQRMAANDRTPYAPIEAGEAAGFLWQGLDLSSPPQVSVHQRIARPGAIVHLKAGRWPVLASWKVGKGTVYSFPICLPTNCANPSVVDLTEGEGKSVGPIESAPSRERQQSIFGWSGYAELWRRIALLALRGDKVDGNFNAISAASNHAPAVKATRGNDREEKTIPSLPDRETQAPFLITACDGDSDSDAPVRQEKLLAEAGETGFNLVRTTSRQSLTLFGGLFPFNPGNWQAQYAFDMALAACDFDPANLGFQIEADSFYGGTPIAAQRGQAVYDCLARGARLIQWHDWGWCRIKSGLGIDPQRFACVKQASLEAMKIGPMLTGLKRPRAGIAMLAPSAVWTTAISGEARAKNDAVLMAAYKAAQVSCGNIDFLYCRHLREGKLNDYPVLLLAGNDWIDEDMLAIISSWVESGKTLLVMPKSGFINTNLKPTALFSKTCPVSFGAPKEGLAVKELGNPAGLAYPIESSGGKVLFTYANNAPAAKIFPLGKGAVAVFGFVPGTGNAMEQVFQALRVDPAIARSSDQDASAFVLKSGAARYLVVVNSENTEKTADIRIKTEFTSFPFVCDMLDGGRHPIAFTDDGTVTIPVDLDPYWGRAIALLPEKPGTLTVTATNMHVGETSTFQVTLTGANGKPLSARVPVEMTVTDASGLVRPEYGGRHMLKEGVFTHAIDLGTNDPIGNWTIQAYESWTGKKAKTVIAIAR